MARDFEDFQNPETLSDEELRALVRQELLDNDGIDADSITVTTEEGLVTLAGRVGTEGERRIAEHILTDVIGLTDFRNDLVVDPIRRDQEPEAADDHAAHAADLAEDALGGTYRMDTEPSAEHLEEDLDEELYGTHDLQSAIQDGVPYEPPDATTQEGFSGTEGDSGAMREDH